jgi:hypothetical protein
MPAVKSNSRNATVSRIIHAKRAKLPHMTNFFGKKIGRPFLGSGMPAYCSQRHIRILHLIRENSYGLHVGCYPVSSPLFVEKSRLCHFRQVLYGYRLLAVTVRYVDYNFLRRCFQNQTTFFSWTLSPRRLPPELQRIEDKPRCLKA